jgi:hypothetical protein
MRFASSLDGTKESNSASNKLDYVLAASAGSTMKNTEAWGLPEIPTSSSKPTLVAALNKGLKFFSSIIVQQFRPNIEIKNTFVRIDHYF